MPHSLLVHGVVPQVREAHPGPETTRTGSREELEPGFTLLVRTFAKGRLDYTGSSTEIGSDFSIAAGSEPCSDAHHLGRRLLYLPGSCY